LPFCPTPTIQKASDYAILELSDKPASLSSNDFIDNLYPGVATGNQYNILHFTDLYIDYNYQEGTLSHCGGLVCCQAKYGSSGFPLAKKYGEKECDTPEATLDEILADVKEKVANPEIILVTGALASRDPNLSEGDRVASFGRTIGKFKTTFPDALIFVALGSTDIAANNQQSFSAPKL